MGRHIDVFISSTSIDLPEHREAVIEALLAIGLFPSGMEHWPVADENPVDFCRQKIAEAEIYVGIYAHRYGWRPGGPGTPSITEMEYDWAGEKGIPRFCFVIDRKHPWPPDQMELEAKADLDAFKARVSERIRGEFTTPDDLKAQTLGALAKYAQKQDISITQPYLRRLHHYALQSGLLHTLDPRTKDPAFRGEQVTVDQVYTPLNTQTQVVREEDGQIAWEAMRQADHEALRERASSPLAAMEAASHYDRLVVLGDPGSGKSTFVSFLALGLTGHLLDPDSDWRARLQDQGWTQDVRLPLHIVLRDFAQDMGPEESHGTAQSLLVHVERQMAQSGCPEAMPAVKQAMTDGQALLILDGLDEVPAERRTVVRDTVQMFMQAFDRCRVLITCRILSYANPEWQIPETDTVTLAPFDEEHIKHFIQAWYAASQRIGSTDPDTAQARIADLTAAVSDVRLHDMAANPMLLTVMAIVHNHRGTLPRETARLYHECVDLLMLRWRPHDAQALKDELGVQDNDLYQALWKLAYDAHDRHTAREGTADLSEADIVFSLRDKLGGLDNAALFCNYVEQRAGLLYGRGMDPNGARIYTFPHRTFQEYLTGCYIASSSRAFNRIVCEKARLGEKWRQVLLLATGQMVFIQNDTERPIDAVERLLRPVPADDEGWRAVWLAGDMLLLIGLQRVVQDDIGQQALPLARERLAVLVSEGHLEPVERAAAGRTLAELGDPRPGVSAPNGVPEFTWCEVPAGSFKMGGDLKAYGTGEEAEFDLPYSFWIAQYPVTYAQYEPFVAAGGYQERRYWTGAGWDDKGDRTEPYQWHDSQWHISNHPVIGVSWYEAQAYTQWLNEQNIIRPADVPEHYVLRLARECEWEKAARYPDERFFPWGDDWNTERLNWDGSGINRTSAVGMFPNGANSAHGACDLIGNVWEWCLTEWQEDYRSPDAENNDPAGDAVRCARGGSWLNGSRGVLRAAARDWFDPFDWNNFFGFRVVWSVHA